MVALLGGFGLFWGSALLRVPRASQRLVAFLALHGGMVSGPPLPVRSGLTPPSTTPAPICDKRARLQSTARKALAASKLELGLADHVTVDLRCAQALACRLLDPTVTPEQSDLNPAAAGTLSARAVA